jgi:hypothetical protein
MIVRLTKAAGVTQVRGHQREGKPVIAHQRKVERAAPEPPKPARQEKTEEQKKHLKMVMGEVNELRQMIEQRVGGRHVKEQLATIELLAEDGDRSVKRWVDRARNLVRNYDASAGITAAYKRGIAEFRHHKNEDDYAVILPDASEPGRWRASFYDKHGFRGHATSDSVEKVIEELADDGYHEPAKGSLDRMAASKDWAEGTARTKLVQWMNELGYHRRQDATQAIQEHLVRHEDPQKTVKIVQKHLGELREGKIPQELQKALVAQWKAAGMPDSAWMLKAVGAASQKTLEEAPPPEGRLKRFAKAILAWWRGEPDYMAKVLVKQHKRTVEGKPVQVKQHFDVRRKELKPGTTPARPAAREEPRHPVRGKDVWAEHGQDKLYALTGKDSYIHSDDAGKKWNRSKIPGANLHDEKHREQVHEHMREQGYHNPKIEPRHLLHLKEAHEDAEEHEGHLKHGVEESRHRERVRRGTMPEDEPTEEELAQEKAHVKGFGKLGAPTDRPTPEIKEKIKERKKKARIGREEVEEKGRVRRQVMTGEVPSDPREHAQVLKEGKIEVGRPLDPDEKGINKSMLLKIEDDGRGIYKAGGETEPNVRAATIPHGTQHKREVAAHEFEKVLGSSWIPPTVSREHDETEGSFQAWLDGAQVGLDVGEHVMGDHMHALQQVAILDAVMGNSDRHLGNIAFHENKVHAIDNGLSFTYGFEGVRQQHFLLRRGEVTESDPHLMKSLDELTYADVHLAIGDNVEPWAVAQTYARAKYVHSKLKEQGRLEGHHLETESLFGWAKTELPNHIYEKMHGEFEWGPKPPGWVASTDGDWPPKGKPGHSYITGTPMPKEPTPKQAAGTAAAKPGAAP